MAYDEGLAERVRERLAGAPGITEQRMFGGLAFLLNGNMAIGVHGDELIVRVPPPSTEEAVARPGVRVFDMTGRPMKGWLLVAPSVLAKPAALNAWIEVGRSYAAGLPPKR